MNVSPIVPCLWLDAEAEEAASFYAATFPNGRITALSRYPESMDNPSGRPRGSTLTVEFSIGGQRFTALNGGPHFRINPSISFFVHVATPDEAQQLFARLADGGEVLMALDEYAWSERYGWVSDRFGVSWQVITGRGSASGAMIVPCLMFAGTQHGRAEEAMQHYTSIFPDGRIRTLRRYTEHEGPAGTLKHGRFVLQGQEMIAMDSHGAHNFGFSEGLSLQVLCEGQVDVDRYWDALSDGGSTGQCGWLKDRFGVSWQVVPKGIADWLGSGDAAGRDRAFQALLGMTKLDVAALKAAHDGAPRVTPSPRRM